MEARIPEDHPLRAVKRMTDTALRGLWKKFEALYSHTGRPSIPPEQLLRALLLQALYSIRSERLLIEQLEYNLLFRWFVGLAMDDRVWDATVFSKNRERVVEGEIARAFLSEVLELAAAQGLISDEHFDGGRGRYLRSLLLHDRLLHECPGNVDRVPIFF